MSRGRRRRRRRRCRGGEAEGGEEEDEIHGLVALSNRSSPVTQDNRGYK